MIPLLLGLALGSAWAGGNHIAAQVLDRNGEPLDRAIVTLAPGNVQLVTDREGAFLIDYLRDEAGVRTKLGKKTEYTLSIFKPGYHPYTVDLLYKHGAIDLDPITLVEETIAVTDQNDELDPAKYADPTHSAGANYEGQ